MIAWIVQLPRLLNSEIDLSRVQKVTGLILDHVNKEWKFDTYWFAAWCSVFKE